MRKRLLVVGLDGATLKIIQPWADAGYLPNLRRIISSGASGALASTLPWVTAPACVSLDTGKNPGKHGCYRFVSSRDIPGKTVYEILSDSGRKVILINLPVSYPPRIPGVVITGMMTQGTQYVFPPNLVHSVPELARYRPSPDKLRAEDIRTVEADRFACAQRLSRMEWDFFFLYLRSSDTISHLHFAKMLEDKSEPARRVFQDLDTYIGWFLDLVDQYTNLLIISDHGFQYHEDVFFVNVWLEQQGYLTSIVDPTFRQLAAPGVTRFALPRAVIDLIYAHPLIYRLATIVYRKVIRAVGMNVLQPTRGIDFEKTVAYSPSPYCQGIYLNHKSRFEGGTVAASQAAALTSRLASELARLRNPHTGRKVFRKVWTKSQVFSGRYTSEAPDILLDPDCSVSHYLPSREPFGRRTTNWHARSGILLADGPDIANGQVLQDARLIDIAPTILHMMGLPVPSDMDGRVLKELFKSGSDPAQRAVVQGKPTGDLRRHVASEFGPEDTEAVRRRLQGLGYL